MNFSFIRPRGSFINGIGVESPGSVKYMEICDTTSDVITAGSGKKSTNAKAKKKIRKGAMMGVENVWHPDIEEFITAKQQPGRLSRFNMSVNCSDEFMDKVAEIAHVKNEIAEQNSRGHGPTSDLVERLENAEKWDLVFPDTTHAKYKKEWTGNIDVWKKKGYPIIVHKTVRVSDLWSLIMQSTYNRNEPGVLFLDAANRTHCWNYAGEECDIQATNPCGEQCLPFGAVCNLASLNLVMFLKDGKFMFSKFKKHVRYLVRLLDNINDLTNAPLEEYVKSIRERRRIGIGVMGWGSMLYLLKTRYASKAAEELKAEIMKCLTHTAVEESIDLAIEKGMFIGCDPEKHSQAEFWNQIGLPDDLREKMKKHGIRNSALFSIQPTGNTSILANIVSGGLEPVFMHEYVRTSILAYVPEEIAAHTPKYSEGEFKETEIFKFTKEGDDTILKAVVNGTTYKIDKTRGLTKETVCEDYAVRLLKKSGEWNPKAPWAVTTVDLSVEEHVTDMTGFGKWIDSSMSKTVNLPNSYSFEKFQNLYLDAYKTGYLKGITTYREGTMQNVLAAVSASAEDASKPAKIVKTKAPKRPSELDGELHHITINKKKLYVAVGLFNNEPYEVFTGNNYDNSGDVYIPKEISAGQIKKKKRGEYLFNSGDNSYNLTNGHADDTADALTRAISMSLRHGVDISIVVHQLEKTDGPLVSFSKALARTLKKYVKDGCEVHGASCDSCGSHKMIRSEGCIKCADCGWSKCG